jgi:hypothetical protein
VEQRVLAAPGNAFISGRGDSLKVRQGATAAGRKTGIKGGKTFQFAFL